jgi:oligopeptide transport system permease protein
MSDPDASAASVASRLQEPVPPPTAAAGPKQEKPRSLSRDAWEDLRSKPIFWIALALITVFVVMAIVPGLFTRTDPTACDLSRSRQTPGNGAVFGYDVQGCDVYARTIYGARASILVGISTTLFATLLGGVTGVVAGFFGGWVDSVISRLTDVFFALPVLLGAILILTSFPTTPDTPAIIAILKVALAIAVLGWTSTTRLMRSAVIQVKQTDYVQAARALGSSNLRIIMRHVIPNSLTAVIVVATLSLGGYIGAEATLSYLGIGLQPPVISWGIAISDAQTYIRTSPHMLLFPGIFLSLTVLAFIMLGEAVREALDPKLR